MTEIERQIQDYIDDPTEDVEGDFPQAKARPPWEVTDEAAADWALDRIRRAEQSLERIQENAAARIAAAKAEVARTRAFFEPLLRQWAERNPPKKGKTIRLFSGDLKWKTKPAGFAYTDEQATIAWAKENMPSAVQTKESLLRTPVSAYAKQVGELPPGVVFIPEEEIFYVD